MSTGPSITSDKDFLDDTGKWKCIQCGACCRMVSGIAPNLDRGDGVCKHLVGNTCSIYETRPLICRTSSLSVKLSDEVMAKACWIVYKLASTKT